MCFRRTPLSCTTRFMWSLWPSSSRLRSPSAHCSATDTNPGASVDDSSASSKRYKHAHISGTVTVTNICVISKRAEIVSLDLIKVECFMHMLNMSQFSQCQREECVFAVVFVIISDINHCRCVCLYVDIEVFVWLNHVQIQTVFCASLLRSLVSLWVICENDTSYLQSSLRL